MSDLAAAPELAAPVPAPDGGRVQLALNVDDLTEAVAFYSKLFNSPPTKLRDGYANFALSAPPLKLVLLENPGSGGTLNHLGIEVPDSATVHGEISRLTEEGLFTAEEIGTTCCFATQDKVWVAGPGGERWEVYTVLADSSTFGTGPKTLAAGGADEAACGPGVCCTTSDANETSEPSSACC